MSKHQKKFKGPHVIQRRQTFKKHSHHYKKVYAPFLPAILISVLSLSIFLYTSKTNGQTLSYATDVSSQRLLEETNSRRVSNDVQALSLNKKLTDAAQKKAEDMSSKNYWSHISPDGKQPWQFITESGYQYSVASENLAYGFNSASETINGWMNSSSHKRAMLDKSVSRVGFGIANTPDYQDRGSQTIIVAIYAKPQTNSSLASVKNLTNNQVKEVSFAQSLTQFGTGQISFIIGGIVGGLIVFLIGKNIIVIRRKIKKGKRFILHHPAYDATALSVIILLVVLSRTSGFIQ